MSYTFFRVFKEGERKRRLYIFAFLMFAGIHFFFWSLRGKTLSNTAFVGFILCRLVIDGQGKASKPTRAVRAKFEISIPSTSTHPQSLCLPGRKSKEDRRRNPKEGMRRLQRW